MSEPASRRPRRRTVPGAALLGVLLACSAGALPVLAGDDPEARRAKLGDALAEDWVALAEARAEASAYGGPDCANTERLARAERKLCGETRDRHASIAKTTRRLEKLRAKGELPPAPAGRRAEDRVFRALRAGLFDMRPRMRFESLRALVEFCAGRGVALGPGTTDVAQSGSDAAAPPPAGTVASTCVVELEAAALSVLANQDDAFLRHFALEILATGRVLSPDALDPLDALAADGRTGERGCEPILDRLGAHRQLEAVARGYQGGFFGCEPRLARTALARMTGD